MLVASTCVNSNLSASVSSISNTGDSPTVNHQHVITDPMTLPINTLQKNNMEKEHKRNEALTMKQKNRKKTKGQSLNNNRYEY